jgi:hypothetical protein
MASTISLASSFIISLLSHTKTVAAVPQATGINTSSAMPTTVTSSAANVIEVTPA